MTTQKASNDPPKESLWALGATQAARLLGEGRITAEALTASCLERIAAIEPKVRAFAFLDAEQALADARECDRRRKAGLPGGPLFGLPVGIKDIIDVARTPTELGSPLHRGRRPRRDATLVARLRSAGAVVLGKTVTTEFAYFTPGPTRNPRDLDRTPGGSSSGSAAAVAAAMLPLAVGTQTNGSMIRPASFCGVFGMKPTFGLIPRTGVLNLSETLDTVGGYGRSLEDVALLIDALAGHDAGDAATRPEPAPRLAAYLAQAPRLKPRLAFVETPRWAEAEADTKAAFAELRDVLGDAVQPVELPAWAAGAWDAQRVIMHSEMAHNLGSDYERGRLRDGEPLMSDRLAQLIEDGRTVRAIDYHQARALQRALQAELAELFSAYDAILTPAAPGQAPTGMATGSPVFCTPWTLAGTPAVSLPILSGAEGLPIGLQIVGGTGEDARLLATARWVLEAVAAEQPPARRKAAKGATRGAKGRDGTRRR
jgi:Asp-tRNA(Asn)/Glu-tRNA(Gln) amidotransferase A subunit family amidase